MNRRLGGCCTGVEGHGADSELVWHYLWGDMSSVSESVSPIRFTVLHPPGWLGASWNVFCVSGPPVLGFFLLSSFFFLHPLYLLRCGVSSFCLRFHVPYLFRFLVNFFFFRFFFRFSFFSFCFLLHPVVTV
ncbi:hypothetical protein EX30DRAFT_335514 [Ascodesmis nigricans]|uniref:Uncharacterized protein n=1 Tax=Ascodesmis nigricans TaxID=341454 RepID=A0A4S2MKG1_9PEZI|nr:hypothetical protein EX30DRAFT_335514 [Ascodesmis nigricans]